MKTLQRLLVNEHPQWFLWTPVLYGTGIGLYFSLPQEPPLLIGNLVSSLCLASCLFFKRNLFLRYLFFALLLVSAGFTISQWRAIHLQSPTITKQTHLVHITGTIADMTKLPSGTQIILTSLTIESMTAEHTPKKIRLNIRTPLGNAATGDSISLLAVLSPPPIPVYPGAYDFSRIAYFQQIGATGYSISPITRLPATPHSTLMNAINAIRYSMVNDVLTILGKKTGGVAAALIAGEQGAVDKHIYQEVRNAGLAHLLSISGLHLALVVGVFFVVGRTLLSCSQTLTLHFDIKKWAAFFALIGSFFYLAIAGFPIPAQRSFIMVGLVLLAILLDRNATPLRSVAIAAFVILIIEPESLLTPSFQMSFAAVTALIASYQWMVHRSERLPERAPLSWWRHLLRYFLGIVFSSLVAGLATTPFSIYHFNTYSSYGILANLIAIPVTSFWIMPLIVCFFLLYPLGLSTWVLYPIGLGIHVIITTAHTIASLPHALEVLPAIPALSFIFMVIGGCWLCLWQQKWRYYGLLLIGIGAASSFLTTTPDIIIDKDGKLFAVKNDDGTMLVSSRQQARYARNIWQQRMGVSTSEKLGQDESAAVQCDTFGCNIHKQGKNIAIVQSPLILAEECHQADIVVNLSYAHYTCNKPQLYLTHWQLYKNGTHTIRLNKQEGISLHSVRQSQGNRLWSHSEY